MAEADEVDRRSVFNEFENDTQKIQIETTTTNNMVQYSFIKNIKINFI
jgi:hypothetical protein